MADIRNAFNAAFPDGPSSNPTQPQKEEIRQIGVTIETAIEGAAAGTVLMPTWAALSAVAGTRVGQPAQVPETDAGTHTDPVVGGTKANAGQYRWSASPAGWQWIAEPALSADAVSTIVDGLTTTVIAVGSSVTDKTSRGEVVYVRPRKSIAGDYYSPRFSNNYEHWSVGFVPDRKITAISGVGFWITDIGTSGATKFRIRPFTRPLSAGDVGEPGEGASDVPYGFFDYAINDTLVESLGNIDAQLVYFDLSTATALGDLDPSAIVMFRIEALDNSNVAKYVGLARGLDTAGAPTYASGWVRQGGLRYNIGPPATLAIAVYERFGTDKADPKARKGIAARRVGNLQTRWPTNPEAVIPELLLDRGYVSLPIKSQLVVFSAPSETSVTDSIVIQYNQAQNLSHQFTRNVVVRRSSDNAILTLGTDYALDADRATVTGLVNIANFAASVTYLGAKSRHDIVQVDPATGQVSVAAGTERGRDAIEYGAAANSGKVPLYRAFVTKNRGVDLVPIHEFRGLMKIGREQEHLGWIEYCRSKLPKLMKAIRTNQTFRVAVDGDSIGTLGGGGTDYYNPNGIYRDTLTYFYGLPTDTLSAIPLFDEGDGGGAIHHRLGYGWSLKRAIEARSGALVEIVNFSYGGTTSDNVISGAPGGAHPARLAAVNASGPVVAIECFGMNELGSLFTYGNIRAIIQSRRTAGIETIVMGVPMIPPTGDRAGVDQWLYTNDQLAQAALDEGAAFIPTHVLVDPENMGAFGFSRVNTGVVNGYNHPGPKELSVYGSMLAALIP